MMRKDLGLVNEDVLLLDREYGFTELWGIQNENYTNDVIIYRGCAIS